MGKGSLRNHRAGKQRRTFVAKRASERENVTPPRHKRDRQVADKALREGTWDSL